MCVFCVYDSNTFFTGVNPCKTPAYSTGSKLPVNP